MVILVFDFASDDISGIVMPLPLYSVAGEMQNSCGASSDASDGQSLSPPSVKKKWESWSSSFSINFFSGKPNFIELVALIFANLILFPY